VAWREGYCMSKSLISHLAVVLWFLSCNGQSVDQESQHPLSFSYRSSKCLSAYSHVISLDSSFVYSFVDSLVLDFSVRANCCPDSDRFAVTHVPSIDTLIISIVDTAQNLCYCTCRYLIHVQFKNLQGDHYVVRCKLTNYRGIVDPIYLVNVYREK
jgi:hypothetical protein